MKIGLWGLRLWAWRAEGVDAAVSDYSYILLLLRKELLNDCTDVVSLW